MPARPFLAAAALAALLAAPVAATAAPFTAEQREALDERIRSYLIENPEVLLEAFEVLERRRQAAEAAQDADLLAARRTELIDDGFSPVMGNPEGDVTVVKFSDYRCGFCKQAFPVMDALIGSDPGVRVVIKEFPILGEDSVFASRAALAAAAIDADLYARLHAAMLTYRGQLTEASVMALAERAGADMDALRREMDNPDIVTNIRATYALARDLRIEGTPSFVVGDSIVRGMVQIDRMRELVALAREERG